MTNSRINSAYNVHPISFEVWTDDQEAKREEIFKKSYDKISEIHRPDLIKTLSDYEKCDKISTNN